MRVATRKGSPSWSDVKGKLTDIDRAGLIALVQDLYAASKDNQAFLHARFALGDDVLKPYKATIDRWLWPDVFKNQDTSVAKAKKAIADYKKAIGQPEGLAELAVFFCERAVGFSSDVGLQDEGYFDALVRMFAQALKACSPPRRWRCFGGCSGAAPMSTRSAGRARPPASRATRRLAPTSGGPASARSRASSAATVATGC
jgi:hypothetical protein